VGDLDLLTIITAIRSSPPAPKITEANPLGHTCTKYYFLTLEKGFRVPSNFTYMTFLKIKIDNMFLTYFLSGRKASSVNYSI